MPVSDTFNFSLVGMSVSFIFTQPFCLLYLTALEIKLAASSCI